MQTSGRQVNVEVVNYDGQCVLETGSSALVISCNKFICRCPYNRVKDAERFLRP